MEAKHESVCPVCVHLIIAGQEIDIIERTGCWAHRHCDPWDLACTERKKALTDTIDRVRALCNEYVNHDIATEAILAVLDDRGSPHAD